MLHSIFNLYLDFNPTASSQINDGQRTSTSTKIGAGFLAVAGRRHPKEPRLAHLHYIEDLDITVDLFLSSTR